MKTKGFKVVIEELKQRISAKSEKLRCYRAPNNQYMQNKLSQCNQKALHQEFGGKVTPAQVPSNAEEEKNSGVYCGTIQSHINRMLNG